MVQIESLRLRYFPFSHRLTLRWRDVWNRRKFSNLPNTCLTTSPADKSQEREANALNCWRFTSPLTCVTARLSEIRALSDRSETEHVI